MIDLKNKTIVITGAEAGIGHGLAKKLDKEGARLILIDLNEISLDEFQHNPTTFQLDLTNEAQLLTLCEELKTLKIDALINNAGIGNYMTIEEMPINKWHQTVMLNLSVPWILTKNVIEPLKRSDLGLVLNIGSVCGIEGIAERSAYCATKFGLRGMTLSLAQEYEGKKPNFCVITLGSTNTNFGGYTAEEKNYMNESGVKKYLDVETLANKLIEIIKTNGPAVEYKIVP